MTRVVEGSVVRGWSDYTVMANIKIRVGQQNATKVVSSLSEQEPLVWQV